MEGFGSVVLRFKTGVAFKVSEGPGFGLRLPKKHCALTPRTSPLKGFLQW